MNVIDDFEYTKIIKPDTENRKFSITLTSADGIKAMSFLKGEQDIVMYDDGKSIRYWSATLVADENPSWLTLADILYRHYVNFITDDSSIAFASSGGAREAADLFAHKIYKEQEFDRVPPGGLSVENYEVVDLRVDDISDDGKKVLGWMQYAILPTDINVHMLEAGSPIYGEGKYEGWLFISSQFVLQKQEDGLWHCIGMGYGWSSLSD
jgi:hypothetical protein